MDKIELFERYGAMVIVLVVLVWFMERSDTRDKLMEKAFGRLSEAITAFTNIERQNRDDHQKILEVLKDKK